MKRKLSGEIIVSSATYMGYKAITTYQAPDNFMVVVMNMDNLSFYVYNVKEEKFCIKDYKESLQHTITDLITTELLQNNDVIKWWKCIFYEHDNVCTYDPYYDALKISDNSDITFKEIIERLSSHISSLQLPTGISQLFLTGDLATNPLIKYVLQRLTASKSVLSLTDFTGNDIPDENEIVIVPKERLDHMSLNVKGSVNFTELIPTSLKITLPLDSIGNLMSSDTKWEDMLVDKQQDYNVGNLAFKTISVRVECDSFQNIFLSCKDLRGNRKVKQFN